MRLRKFLNKIFSFCAARGYLNWLPDQMFLKIKYWIVTGTKLNLKSPQTFNEKLQWLKIYDRKPIYTTMVDKYEAKKYISDQIGEQYVIPTLGIWEKFDDIDFNTLPNQFVLKCTHDSGGIIICRDKSQFDIKTAKNKLTGCLNRNFYSHGREWPYKNIKPKIIAEKYMVDKSSYELKKNNSPKLNKKSKTSICNQDTTEELVDYKFYCFNGKAEYLYVSQGLENHATARISFLTLNWEFAPFNRNDYMPFEDLPPKPEHYDEMLYLAQKFARGFPFLRVDFYEINGQVYFSEFTFTPCSGMMPFNPPEWDDKLGKLLQLKNK